MGKRELLLIAFFIIVGAVVYRVTVPADASGRGLSVSRMIDHIRSVMRGQNVERQTVRTVEAEADGIATLRLGELRGIVRVIGEERQDVVARLKATVFGADEAQARQFEKSISLTLGRDDSKLDLRMSARPPEMHRRPVVELVVNVPAHLAVEVDFAGGELSVSRVTGVTLERAAGKLLFSAIGGGITGELRQGSIEVDAAETVDLETHRADVRVMNVSHDVKLAAQGGDVRVRGVGGSVELSLERIDAEVEDITGPLKIDVSGGQLNVRNPAGPVAIEVERMEVALTLATAVPVEASTSGDTLEIALPPQGLHLQLTAKQGEIRASDPSIKITEDDEQIRHAATTLRGGGPLVKLETTRGDIVIR